MKSFRHQIKFGFPSKLRATLVPGNDDGKMNRYIIISLVVHVLIFVMLIATPALVGQKKYIRRERVTWVQLPKGLGDKIAAGIKKSKGMPQTTIAESKKPLAVPPPPTTLKDDALTYQDPKLKTEKKPAKAVTSTKKSPTYKSKTDNALARLEKSVKARVPEAAQIPKELEEGGVPFGTTEGPYLSPDDPIYILYQGKIRHKIMEAWVLPISFMGQDIPYRCTLVVRIDDRGKVIRAKFEDRSGNEAFDESAFRAIYRASPLDIPPEKLKREAVDEGFLIEFDPETKL